MKKILIVGGVAGGATTAARLRRLDEEAQIIMFEKGEYISFANCGLPYHIGEVIKERSSLLVTTKEAFYDRYRIDIRNNSEVIKVDTLNKKVAVMSKDRGEYEESYDYLVLSPGAKPFRPETEGLDDRILSLRNVPDTDAIKAIVDKNPNGEAVVIGGGFIGIEMAENLRERGMKVTLIEAAPHILAPFDSEMSMILEKEMRNHGVRLILNDGVKKFEHIGERTRVTVNSGTIVEADLVVSAIGVRPDTDFLKDSGIELNNRGYIVTDKYLRTNKEGVYAAGDAIETTDYVTKDRASIALAGPANRQGRIIADNISGMEREYKGSLGSSIVKVFSLTGANTGNNERQLKNKGIKFKSFIIHPQSHATYYPGAKQFTAKIIVGEDKRLLGAQAVGYDGIDKFIDVAATVIKFNGTIDDLAELDLTYAPPYSSAKSPLNIAGFVAQNSFEDIEDNKSIFDYTNGDDVKNEDDNHVILDVREPIEVENGALDGHINIPVNKLRENLDKLDKNKHYNVYCQVGLRGHVASRILSQNGFKNTNLGGGYRLLSLGKSSEDSFNKEENGQNGSHENEDNKGNINPNSNSKEEAVLHVDACGISCPGPLLKVKEGMDKIKPGESLTITASDPGFYEDVKAFARRTDASVEELTNDNGIIKAKLKKKRAEIKPVDNIVLDNGEKNKTIVVFSGDLDKAIASFIIANGAKAMGGKVTMFFTFWGINIIRKDGPTKVNKNPLEKMFGIMMPKGAKKLKLSNMNMLGIGPKLIRGLMHKKSVDSLDILMKKAIDSGIELVACQMSMDLLGFKKEELLDEVKTGGVGYYLGEAEESKINLFI